MLPGQAAGTCHLQRPLGCGRQVKLEKSCTTYYGEPCGPGSLNLTMTTLRRNLTEYTWHELSLKNMAGFTRLISLQNVDVAFLEVEWGLHWENVLPLKKGRVCDPDPIISGRR